MTMGLKVFNMSEYNTNKLSGNWVKRSLVESFNLSLTNPVILFAVVVVMMAINYFSNYYGDIAGVLSCVLGAIWIGLVFLVYSYVDTGSKAVNIGDTVKSIGKAIVIIFPYIFISNFANVLFSVTSGTFPIKVENQTVMHLMIFALNGFSLYLFILIPICIFFATFIGGGVGFNVILHYTSKGFFENMSAFIYVIIISVIAKMLLFIIISSESINLNVVLLTSIVSIYVNVILTGILYVILRDIFIGPRKKKQQDTVKVKRKSSFTVDQPT
jgi:hypothetical protein